MAGSMLPHGLGDEFNAHETMTGDTEARLKPLDKVGQYSAILPPWEAE